MTLINIKTESLIDNFIDNPSSSLVLEGSKAFSIEAIINKLALSLLGATRMGNLILIGTEDEKSIGIETVRQLKSKLSTISGKERKVTRIAAILHADRLTEEAQNAILKLVEEPAKNTLIILCVDRRSSILKTIQSRCQIIPLLPISKSQADEYTALNGIDPKIGHKAFMISKGAPKLFMEIINDSEDPLVLNIETAKQFLKQTRFERLQRQKEFNSFESLDKLISSLILVSEAGMHSAKRESINRWQIILNELQQLSIQLKKNVNVKLVYLRTSIML